MLTRVIVVAAVARAAAAGEVTVTTSDELRAAVEGASAGDEITLAPGTYVVTGNLGATAAGTEDAPIVVRAEALGDAFIQFDAVEGFHVQAADWTFENLDIEGVCAADDDCEHAFHVTGDAERTTVRGCRLHEFNAMIKGNGTPTGAGGAYVWPDDVVIENSEFFSEAPRDTGNPVTPIDVVGGRRWIVRANFIHDHAKGGGDNISYAAFLKGNSRDGLFERNLVICEWLTSGQVRLGLSFGGGGSGPDMICEDSTCTPEHQNGIMRNNIVVACPADVGIYVNEGQDVRIYDNTLYDTTGIDLRFSATSADVRNNLLGGGMIRERDGASSVQSANVAGTTADFAAWFADPAASDFALVNGAAFVDAGETLDDVFDDFCTNDRDDGATDVGAVEYDGDGLCDTTAPFAGGGGEGESESEAEAEAESEGEAEAEAEAEAESEAESEGGDTDGCGCSLGARA